MTIVPDTKDWTWVLERPCPSCGFDPVAIDARETGQAVRDRTAPWAAILARADVRERPRVDTWSPLEYGCHVRDVCRTFDGRLVQLLTEDDPTFENWDQDATALELRYDLEDPASIAGELEASADVLSTRFASVTADQWERTGTRSNGSRFTVATLGVYCVHDLHHHLSDVG